MAKLEARSTGRAKLQISVGDQMTHQGAWLAADQQELMEPEALADPDSCFSEFNGVKIHYKMAYHDKETVTRRQPMILLHGFGASVFTWNRVMKPLSELQSGSKVLAFDRPAFGLTSRAINPVSDLKRLSNPYSMAYSVLSTLFFVNYLGSEKTVLIGHSMGSIIAINTYFEAPERVSALILVAPAIVAPFTSGGVVYSEKEQFDILARIYKFIREAILQVFKWIGIVFAAILRSSFGLMLVRMAMDKFGVAIVKFAWHGRVSEHTLDGYTKPLGCKDWDRALVEFFAAMLDITDKESSPVPTKRLSEIKCPVLVITGDDDRLVPAWNSKRISKAIPGSVFEVIKECGHVPHEEKTDEFVSVVQRFLERVDVSL